MCVCSVKSVRRDPRGPEVTCYLTVLRVCARECVLCVHACISIFVHPVCIRAGGILICSGRANLGSIEAQHLHIAPDWVKPSYTVHPS